jgi:acetyl esterase/lipase
VLYYLALRAAGVAAEMHIFESGAHGLGLAQEHAALSAWPLLLENWLVAREILCKKEHS